MALELTITKEDLDSREYSIIQKLNGYRFKLEERIKAYSTKEDGTNIFQSLLQFTLVQSLAYDKLRKTADEQMSLLTATCLAARHGSGILQYSKNEESTSFDNKRVDYTKPFPEPANDLLKLYVHSLEEQPGPTCLEAITESFFTWAFEDAASQLEERGLWDDIQRAKITITQKKENGMGEKRTARALPTSPSPAKESSASSLLSRPSHRNRELDIRRYIQPPPSSSSVAEYIYGNEQVKAVFAQLAAMVQHREYFTQLFHPRRLFPNYLLIGPPGTGKTTLVTDLAQRCGLAFAKVPCVELGSEFFSKSSRNIHGLYESGRQGLAEKEYLGLIIFFDEFDHLAKRRGYGHSTESDSCITALNENLDGGSTDGRIITIAATNVEEMLDPAVTNKFQKLYVPYPASTEGIIGIHQAIIRKMEDYAHQKLFAAIAYEQILPFSTHDSMFKSGRKIEQVLYQTAVDKALQGLADKKYVPVTTENLIQAYSAFNGWGESSPSCLPFASGRTVTA